MNRPLPAKVLLRASNRGQRRAWLKKNCKSATEFWLVYYNRHAGRPRISYNDAVEETLCFARIDSTVRTLDEDRFAQRFSVRRLRSTYSQANIERLRALAKQGRIAKDVLESLPDLDRETLANPADVLRAIEALGLEGLPAVLRILRSHPHRLHRGGAQPPRPIQVTPCPLRSPDGGHAAVRVRWN